VFWQSADAEEQAIQRVASGTCRCVCPGTANPGVARLKRAFREAVDDYLATCERVGKAPEKPYSGRVMFRVAPDTHAQVALAAQLAGKSLNQWAEEILRATARRDLAESGAPPGDVTADDREEENATAG
jgi:predicted HicB family RNase H-like nuclease